MSKYLTIFHISWQNEFTYRINFILWRFRNVLRFLMAYFLWSGVFLHNASVFGYQREDMLTYVFLTLLVSTFVISAPSGEYIGGEIADGSLSNYLLKPVGYLKFWFTRDLASKFLNMCFASVEIGLLFLILKPVLKLPTDLGLWIGFVVTSILAAILFFYLSCMARFVAFWAPENTWGIAFIFFILIDLLGGAIFPVDIMPIQIQNLLQFTPFPYLIYYPIAIFLGKLSGVAMVKIIFQSLLWCGIAYFLSRFVWQKGLRVYSSEGR